MTQMKEAVAELSHRYFGHNEAGKMKEYTDVRVTIPQGNDDFCHLAGSGVLELKKDNIVDAFKEIENTGKIAELVGMKAEIISNIYLRMFKRLQGNALSLDFDGFKIKLEKYYENEVQKEQLDYHKYCKENNKPYSHREAVQKLFEEYDKKWPKFEEIISDKEIQRHIDHAEKIYNHIKKHHPECFEGDVNYDKLLELDTNAVMPHSFFLGIVKHFSKSHDAELSHG